MKIALDNNSLNSYTYTVSIDAINQKMTISATGSFHITGGNINNLLGLPAISSPGTTITGDNVIQLNCPNFIHMRSNLGSLFPYAAQIDDNALSNNIIARIQLDKDYNETVRYKVINDKQNYFSMNNS